MPTEYDLFADVYECQYGTTTVDLDFYVGEARSARPPVLELACGTGRVTIPVAHDQAQAKVGHSALPVR